MTEYWVSQGNKWCDFCKIFISNNPSSIRNHELGQRQKDNVANKITSMRKDNAAKDKAAKDTARAVEQIEARSLMEMCTSITLMESGRSQLRENLLPSLTLLCERLSTRFKVVRSVDLFSYCAEEGVMIIGEGKFLVSDSFPGNEKTKYCLTSKVVRSGDLVSYCAEEKD